MDERAARHRLIVRDTIALSTLLALAIALSFVTYLLFHSFSAHRQTLERRWRLRGEAALANHQPLQAVDSLRSALAYAPDDRGLQIELATALAAAGQTQEAVVYFNTLHEAEPGNGMINLQLARLAAAQDNVSLAVSSYEAALDGTWNGDGVVRRRQTRLELSRYLIAQHRFDEARNQLLITAGNAADNHGLQLTVAALLEQAEGSADALELYRKAAAFRETRTQALVGAGRTAAVLNRYLLARNLLSQAVLQPDYNRLAEDERTAVHGLLDQATAILALYPGDNLSLHVQAVRVAHAAQLAQARLSGCDGPGQALVAGGSGRPGAGAGIGAGVRAAPRSSPQGSQTGSTQPDTRRAGFAGTSIAAEPERPSASAPTTPPPTGPLLSALGAVQRARETLTGNSAPQNPVPPGAASAEAQASADAARSALAARWQQLQPSATLARRLEGDPLLLDGTLQLVYQTERVTAQLCGPPTGEDALLLKIAQAPDQIDQQ
jgi:tetratricopeptide (TPR) repeat protein